MPRGGKREGAGRKPGVPIKRTQEVLAKAKELGITPFEVMMDNMKFYHEKAQALTGQLQEVASEIRSQDIIEGNEIAQELIQLIGKVTLFRDRAQQCAVDAAPYMHPRLAAIAVTDNPNEETFKQITKNMTPKQAAEAYASSLRSD